MFYAVIMLLNMLIAMMSASFTNVSEQSFTNYALRLAALLVELRCSSDITSAPPPLNLLPIPYSVSQLILRACRQSINQGMPRSSHR